MRFFRALAASFSYFSIFPSKTFDVAADGDAIAVLPVVGLVIGVLAGFGGYGVYWLTQSSVAAAIAAWILSIALSGAIHVDGFLDCCDSLFAMASPARRLEIMRDPHHGTYAVVGMMMLGAVWIYALAQITPTLLPLAVAATGFIGRLGALGCAAQFKNERTQKPLRLSQTLEAGSVIVFMTVFGPVFFAYHNYLGAFVLYMIAIFAPLAVSTLVGWLASRRLGGVVNGDCYGAVVVVTEVALLLVVPYLKLLP